MQTVLTQKAELPFEGGLALFIEILIPYLSMNVDIMARCQAGIIVIDNNSNDLALVKN